MTTPSSKPKSLVPVPDWMQVTPNLPPSFPSFKDLVIQDLETSGPNRRGPGLFESLLGGNPAPIWQDLEQYPDKYEPAVEPLLRDLVTGARTAKSLSTHEMFTLDRAVVDFAAPPPKGKTHNPPVETAAREPKRERPTEEPRPGVDVPADLEMPAYWWLR